MELKDKILEKVRGYYLRGLNAKETGKLLDISPRTVQRYISQSGCRKISEPKTIQQKAFELSGRGYSYAEVAKKLRVSKTTVYLWHKKRKQSETVSSQ
ncbi:MAG: helix-turn-helix domain-containing protein [Prevotellaceae bacterium]|jgi:transposase|nr:helix-turn-helix domain-containing protein [Prevotellaceae bacterium]